VDIEADPNTDAIELRNLRLLGEYCSDVIATVTPNMLFSYISPSVERLFGWPVEAALGHPISNFVVADDLPEIAAATAKLNEGEIMSATVTVRIKRYDGTVVWTEITSRPIRSADNAELGERAVVIRDITERKILQEKLLAMAMKDGLTGLANRRAFDIALREAWANVKNAQSQMSLLLLDVDYFKEFNDAYGHQTGDDCLRAIATVLQTLPIGSGDVVARYGGEELAIILTCAGVEAAANIGKLACNAVRDLRLPHKQSCAKAGTVTISVGAATVLWRHGGAAKMPDALIASADRALYQAKRDGRDQVCTGLVLSASG
jgi:diguanylate cyclase (GGDEF)-like protein/PAS domain S-box-containing protein